METQNRNGSTILQNHHMNNVSQSNVIGVQTGLSLQNSIQTSVAPTSLPNLSLPSISLNLNNINSQNIQTSIQNTNDFAHNLVLNRNIPLNNGIEDLYRQPMHVRNGIHEYRRDDMSPSLNFLQRDYEDEDSPQSNVLRNMIERPPEITENRVIEDKRILKPAPLQATRLLSVVDADAKDFIKKFYVIPNEKKFVVIKNEPTETMQVSFFSVILVRMVSWWWTIGGWVDKFLSLGIPSLYQEIEDKGSFQLICATWIYKYRPC